MCPVPSGTPHPFVFLVLIRLVNFDLDAHGRESDAILTYIVEKYDPTHKISFKSHEDKIHQLQWLFFQASGQGCVQVVLFFPGPLPSLRSSAGTYRY